MNQVTRTRSGLGGNKRKADISPKKVETKKRSAFGDLTNVAKKKPIGLPKKDVGLKGIQEKVETKPSLIPITTAQEQPRVTRARSKSSKDDEPIRVEKTKTEKPRVEPVKRPTAQREPLKLNAVPETTRILREILPASKPKPVVKLTRRSKSMNNKEENNKTNSNLHPALLTPNEDDSLYQTAYSTPVLESPDDGETTEEKENRKNALLSKDTKSRLPDGVNDFDQETGADPFQVGLYVSDIFSYYKRRETRFPIKKYLDKQTELNKNMRSILVDWMVEVQESFEMNHETLYLAVKLVDLFLGKTLVKREKLQLVGTTALYISAKYDERCPPVIDDFCYICDDAYSQRDVIQMEEKMLKTLDFDIGVPLSYRFLRRYARCAKLDMETLTLARYILEMSLMEYDFIDGIDSMMGAAALYLALKILKIENPWSATLKYYSGYSSDDLFDISHRLYAYLRTAQPQLKTIRSKYSHKVFYEVAKIPLPDELKL